MALEEENKHLEERATWPFRDMCVGETSFFPFNEGKQRAIRAQSYCHIYGRQSGKEFRTGTIRPDHGEAGIIVRRVK
jgi:hypothetical protein